MTKKFIKCALIRAVRTITQVMLGYLTIGATIGEVRWLEMLSVSVVAGVYSIVNSIATGLPEVDE